MTKLKIKLDDNTFFNQDEIQKPENQFALRRVYEQNEKPRAFCCCNGESESLELVIAFRRKSGFFELRKRPGQDYRLHNPLCRFHSHSDSANHSVNSKSLWVALPSSENQYLSDHKACENLLKTIVHYVFDESEIQYWTHFKNEVLEYAQNHIVNDKPLYEILNVLKPNQKQFLKPIFFRGTESRLLLGEVLHVHYIQSKNTTVIKVKGTEEPVWFNHPEFRDSDRSNLARIATEKNKRLLILATIRKTKGGNVVGHGLSTMWVNQTFNSQQEVNNG